MQSTSSIVSPLALPVSPNSSERGNPLPSTSVINTAQTTMPVTTPTTTSTTTASITAPPTTTTSQPVLFMPTNRSEWVNSLLHQQKTGVPPLHQALIDKDDELAAVLIAAGAELSACTVPALNQKDKAANKTRPLIPFVCHQQWAIKGSESRVRSSPVEEASTEDPLYIQPILDFVLFLEERSPRFQLHYNGCNALTLALLSDASLAMTQKLFEAAAERQPTLFSERDSLGRTPLTIAAERGDTAMVQLLLKFNADANKTDGQGRTPFDCALQQGHTAVAQLLIESGFGAPERRATQLPKMDGAFGAKQKHQANPTVDAMFTHHTIDALLTYQQQSNIHRIAVFQALIKRCKEAVDSGTPRALDQLLSFAQPLLTHNRLAKMALAIARRPGTQSALMTLMPYFGEAGFPPKKLSGLRDAAGKSRDPAVLELAIALDQSLSKLISGKARPSRQQQLQLNRLLVLAMQVRDDALVSHLQGRGARLDPKDPALTGLPLISILADFGNLELMRDTLGLTNSKKIASLYLEWLHAIENIHTGEGLIVVERALGKIEKGALQQKLLWRAVQLNSEWVVDELVKAGAKVDTRDWQSKDDPSFAYRIPDAVPTAIAAGNLAMLKKLISLGARIWRPDVFQAYQVSDAFGQAVESLT